MRKDFEGSTQVSTLPFLVYPNCTVKNNTIQYSNSITSPESVPITKNQGNIQTNIKVYGASSALVIYEKRVKNDRKNFEIHAFLSSKR